MADPPLLSLDDHPSLREQIVRRLRQAIVAGEIPARTRLREPELAAQLGVSRTPLREAIRQLEAEGLVNTVPRLGTFVSEVSPRDVEDTYAIRAVLEGLAARQAAKNPDPAKVDRLREILAELGRKTADFRVYHEAAGRFHEAILALSGNQRLQTMYQSLTNQVARFRSLSLAVPQRPEVSFREHRRIATAILSGRGAEAEKLMRSHIEGARVILRQRITPAQGRAGSGNGGRGRPPSRRQA
ncbi:MAG TPA: GntR family transcriptional regulator [Candidatus Methylomirabilis sp.]|nr:GntR family transcriptional regulator [Candidatus Methylomirabilis sp.]